MVPRHHREHVGPEHLQPPLHPRERGMDAEDEVAVLGLRPDQEAAGYGLQAKAPTSMRVTP